MSDQHFGGAARGSYRSYLTGFLLSIALTAVPFSLVILSRVSGTILVPVVGAFALAQIGVHLVFFLHLDRSSGQRWNLIVLAYTIVVLAILVGASVWILYHLNANMMPTQMAAPPPE